MTKETSSLNFSAEQLALVERISASNNYYEVLCVRRDASIREIDQSYKKIALKLHPDKNHAPGSEDAFKTVGTAVDVLTNVEKRRKYDSDLYVQERKRFNGRFQNINNEQPSGKSSYRRFDSTETDSDEDSDKESYEKNEDKSLLRFIILLALAAFILVLSYYDFFERPPYSLFFSDKYPIMRQTQMLKVRYYVKDNFHFYYLRFLKTVELSVEEEYVAILKYQCYYQKSGYQCFWYFVYNILLNLIYFINAISKIFWNDEELEF